MSLRGSTLISAFVLALPLNLFAQTEEIQKDILIKLELKRLEGTWQPTSYEFDGKKIDADQLKTTKVTISAEGKGEVRRDGELLLATESRIDPTKTPRNIDSTYTFGEKKGQKVVGIYDLQGDKNRICFAPQGKDRPTEFSAPEGSGRVLIQYERIKK